MIRPVIRRLFATPGHFAIRTHRYRTAGKELHQFLNHLGRRYVPVEQIQHLIFQRVIAIGAIDLQGLLSGRVALEVRAGRLPLA